MDMQTPAPKLGIKERYRLLTRDLGWEPTYQSKEAIFPYTRYEGIKIHDRSEEHTSELQSLMRISYAVFCLKKKKQKTNEHYNQININTPTNVYKKQSKVT